MTETIKYCSFDYLRTSLVLCAVAAGCVAMIHTDQQTIGWVGENIRLPCDFSYQDVLALYWTNGSDTTRASFFKQERRSFDDRFTLNEDFSLGISDIEVSDEGRYTCRLELESGTSYVNHTEMNIYALPSMPRIEQCAQKPKGNEVHRFCSLETSNTHPFNLDCRVIGFRPNVTLEWTSSGIVKQPLGKPFQRTLPDGTFEREVTISVTAKLNEEQNYTCTVRGEATNGADWSTTVTVLVPPTSEMGLSVGVQVAIGIAAFLVALCIILVVVLGVMLGLRRKKKLPPKGEAFLNHIPFLRTIPQPDPEEVNLQHLRNELSSLREKLRDYTFERPDGCTVKSAHIGLFGEMSAGKSSFMNSLEFAFRGEFKQSQAEGAAVGSAKTMSRPRLNLSDNISLFDNRGMVDFRESHLQEIVAQLGGQRGPDLERIEQSDEEEIHCAVFVFKVTFSNRKPGMDFVGQFEKAVRQYHGYAPMIVITHADSISNDEREGIKNDLANYHDVDKNVWFFENYTKKNSVEDEEKSIELLKFLDDALSQCKLTVVHTERKKKVKPIRPTEKPSTSQGTARNESKGVWGWVKSWFV